jgi:hypothetical protein
MTKLPKDIEERFEAINRDYDWAWGSGNNSQLPRIRDNMKRFIKKEISKAYDRGYRKGWANRQKTL